MTITESAITDDFGLTNEQVQFFNDNGFVGPFDLYHPDDASLLWDKIKIELALSRNKPHNSTVINYDRHLDCDTLSAHVCRPEITHKVRSLMGNDVLCWKTNIFKKEPGEVGTGWHQVETFIVGETTTKASPSLKFTEEVKCVSQEVSVWTAFSPADREHGCLRFIPGSHKRWYYDETKSLTLNVESKKHDFFGYDYSELKLDQNWDPDEEECIDMVMKPGQFVMFTEKCIHGSLRNVSDRPRLGFASRYVVPSVKVYEDVNQLSEFGDTISLEYHGCVLVTGEDRYGYNRILEKSLNGFEFPKC